MRKFTLPMVIAVVIILAIILIYCWQLGSSTPGLSQPEVAARSSSQSLQYIINSPVNAPHRLLQLLFLNLSDSNFYLRLASSVFALAFLGCFYLAAKLWFGRLIGLLSTLMLASTPWLILAGRNATPDIMSLAPLGPIASYLWLTRSRHKNIAWLLLFLTIGLSTYTPGAVWLLVFGLALVLKRLLKFVNSVNPVTIITATFILICVLLPLGRSIFNDPSISKTLLLIPDNLPAWVEALKFIVWSILSLVWQTPEHMALNIGRLPLLNVPQIVLLLFGIYAMLSRARPQLYALLVISGLAILIVGLNQNIVLLLLVLPVMGLLIAAGLRYLYVEWLGVFPRNPIPKTLALLLMAVLVVFNIAYGVRYSLVAWPRTVDTRQTYMLK